jgi:hypothetical protein
MDGYDEIVRSLGRIEGRLDELRDLSGRVSCLEHWLSWLKGGWAVMASVLTYLLRAAYAKGYDLAVLRPWGAGGTRLVNATRLSGRNPWNGYSTAHWEGDTLVVQTEGFRDDLWIDTWGSPMSDAAKMTERIRRANFGTLEIELSIDDPKVYTKPFTVKLTDSLETDTDLVDEFCLEGEKDYERLQRSRGK